MARTRSNGSTHPVLTRFTLLAAFALLPFAAHAQDGTDPSADPPSQAARLSVLNGNVSYEPAGANNFGAAELNYPLTNGDRLYSGSGSSAEVQLGGLAIRMGAQTDFTVTAITDTAVQFGLAQGSVHLRSYALDPNVAVELDTPNVALFALQAGDVRVDVDPNSGATVVTVLSGVADVEGSGLEQQLEAGQSLQIYGSNPVSAQWTRPQQSDALDAFSGDRDNQYQQALDAEGSDLNPQTVGGEDLVQYGDWQSDPDNGAVWYPRGVAVDWQPYRFGHWVYIAPWGWTWVESEPWGFAPFHYGRWARFGPRWGWVPGPRVVRPVWSPALVVFVGAPGVTAWFPLGPREPFVPWYRTSPLYVNRVNVSNIYSRDTVQVRNIYNQRTVNNVYIQHNTTVYINRQRATVAVSQNNFASGRPVAQNALRGPQPRLANAPIASRPPAAAPRTPPVTAPARALPPRVQRPVLPTHTVPVQRPGDPAQRPGNPGQRPANPPGGPSRGNPAPGNPSRGTPPSNPAPISRQPPSNTPNPGRAQPPNRVQPIPPGQAPMSQPNPGRAQPPDRVQPIPPGQAPVSQPNPGRAQPPDRVQPIPPGQAPVSQPNPGRAQPPIRVQPIPPGQAPVTQPNPGRAQPPIRVQPIPPGDAPVNPPTRPTPNPTRPAPTPTPTPSPQPVRPTPQPVQPEPQPIRQPVQQPRPTQPEPQPQPRPAPAPEPRPAPQPQPRPAPAPEPRPTPTPAPRPAPAPAPARPAPAPRPAPTPAKPDDKEPKK